MSQKINPSKTSIPIRVNSFKGCNQENEPNKVSKNRSPPDPSKGVLKQRNPSGLCNHGKAEERKYCTAKTPSGHSIASEHHPSTEPSTSSFPKVRQISGDSVPKTRHISGDIGPSLSKTRHTSGDSTHHQRAQARHHSGHTCKAKETLTTSKIAGRSFSETKKLVHSLQQELASVKKELESAADQNQMLLAKQEEQETRLVEDQENVSLLNEEVKQLQEKLFVNENLFEVLGYDPVSKEKLDHLSEQEETAQKDATEKAMELQKQLLRFTEKNKEIISALKEIIQDG